MIVVLVDDLDVMEVGDAVALGSSISYMGESSFRQQDNVPAYMAESAWEPMPQTMMWSE